MSYSTGQNSFSDTGERVLDAKAPTASQNGSAGVELAIHSSSDRENVRRIYSFATANNSQFTEAAGFAGRFWNDRSENDPNKTERVLDAKAPTASQDGSAGVELTIHSSSDRENVRRIYAFATANNSQFTEAAGWAGRFWDDRSENDPEKAERVLDAKAPSASQDGSPGTELAIHSSSDRENVRRVYSFATENNSDFIEASGFAGRFWDDRSENDPKKAERILDEPGLDTPLERFGEIGGQGSLSVPKSEIVVRNAALGKVPRKFFEGSANLSVETTLIQKGAVSMGGSSSLASESGREVAGVSLRGTASISAFASRIDKKTTVGGSGGLTVEVSDAFVCEHCSTPSSRTTPMRVCCSATTTR
jgi:hypothetical protein